MKFIITLSFLLWVQFIAVVNAQIAFKDEEIISRIKVLEQLDSNYLLSSQSIEIHNVEKIEYYSFELFKKKLNNKEFLSDNVNKELLFRFFKELYFNNNDRLSQLLACYEYYKEHLSTIIENTSLPVTYLLLPAVLSAYNYKFRDNNGVGMWRMNYMVALRSKMLIDKNVDERYLPLNSSKAAFNYLEHLMSLYSNADYAILAYLSSPIILNNAIQSKSDVMKTLASNVVLDFHFFKALQLIEKLRDELGLQTMKVGYNKKTDNFLFDKRFHFNMITKKMDIPLNELIFLNPKYRNLYSSQADIIQLPIALGPAFKKLVEDSIYKNDSLYFPLKISKDVVLEDDPSPLYHTIRKGETLSAIASHYKNVTVNDIVRLNKLSSPDKIREGQKLKIR